jgi:hypothetical protein
MQSSTSAEAGTFVSGLSSDLHLCMQCFFVTRSVNANFVSKDFDTTQRIALPRRSAAEQAARVKHTYLEYVELETKSATCVSDLNG